MIMQNREQTKILKSTFSTEREILQELKKSPIFYGRYQALNSDWKQRFMDFCIGRKTLPLTYDPFFKRIFHPDIHPDRLSRLLSSLLDHEVKVIRILPTEETLLEGGALLIMDILVELKDGSLANVEVQKIPYNFPAERMSCYSADLLLRQYNRVKGERGKDFKYNDIKKVYTIILYEKSTAEFHMISDKYVHIGKTTFDTGLSLELLQEYCLVALDVFREIPYPKDRTERNAWLGLLATENVDGAELLIKDYPWLAEVYEEIAGYMRNPEEVLMMFSDALKILDNNTVQYMIEEQAQKLEEQLHQLDAQTQQLNEQAMQLNAQNKQLDEQAMQLNAQNKQLDEQAMQLNAQAQELAAKDQQLAEAEYKISISIYQDLELTKENAVQKLMKKFHISQELAEQKIAMYW